MEDQQLQEQVKRQRIPVKVYRTGERLMIAAPMAGLEPENILLMANTRAMLATLRAVFKHDCTSYPSS